MSVAIEMNDGNPERICYLLKSFPVYSETFISEEILSLVDYGLEPLVLSMKELRAQTLHQSVMELMDRGYVEFMAAKTAEEKVNALLWLLRKKPYRLFSSVVAAVKRKGLLQKYFGVIPYARMLLEKDVKRIHCHFADENFVMAKILSDLTGLPYGVTTHGYDLRDAPISIEGFEELGNDCDIVIAISDFNKGVIETKYRVRESQIEVVRCGVRTDFFKTNRGYHKREILHLLHIGRLVEEKGQETIIEALAQCNRERAIATLRIVGDGPLRHELERLVQCLGLGGYVKFLGEKTQEEVKRELDSADIFVMASTKEGIPVAAMEAMAMRLPVIATNITGLQELIEDGVEGILVGPNDPEKLCEAVSALAGDTERRRSMGNEARRKVVREFDRAKNTEKLIRLWN